MQFNQMRDASFDAHVVKDFVIQSGPDNCPRVNITGQISYESLMTEGQVPGFQARGFQK